MQNLHHRVGLAGHDLGGRFASGPSGLFRGARIRSELGKSVCVTQIKGNVVAADDAYVTGFNKLRSRQLY